MAWWLVIALVALIVAWLKWGQYWYARHIMLKANQQAVNATLGAAKITGDIVGTYGEIKGVADAITHGQGNFFSRATGAFSSLVG